VAPPFPILVASPCRAGGFLRVADVLAYSPEHCALKVAGL